MNFDFKELLQAFNAFEVGIHYLSKTDSAADFETELAAIKSSPIYWELPNQDTSSGLLCLLMLVLPILVPLILLGIGLRLLMVRRFRRSR